MKKDGLYSIFIIITIVSGGTLGLIEMDSPNLPFYDSSSSFHNGSLNTTTVNESVIFEPIYSTKWRFTLDGYESSSHRWQGMEVTSNEEIFAFCTTYHFDFEPVTRFYETCHLVKWNKQLEYQWNVTLMDEEAYSMATDGEFIYTQGTKGVRKWNSDGNILWGPLDYTEYGHIIDVDSTGSIYIVGTDFEADYSCVVDSWATLTKLSASGTLLWTVEWGKTESDSGFDVQTDGSGNVYTLSDRYVTKWTSEGEKIWELTRGSVIAVRSDGSLYTIGRSGENQFRIDLYNSDGTHLWNATDIFPGDPRRLHAAITTGSNGGLYIFIQSSEDYNVLLMKYDSGGTRVWNRSLGELIWWRTYGDSDVWLDASIAGQLVITGNDRFNTSYDIGVFRDYSIVTTTSTWGSNATSTMETTNYSTATNTTSVTQSTSASSTQETTSSSIHESTTTSFWTPDYAILTVSGLVGVACLIIVVIIIRKKSVT